MTKSLGLDKSVDKRPAPIVSVCRTCRISVLNLTNTVHIGTYANIYIAYSFR